LNRTYSSTTHRIYRSNEISLPNRKEGLEGTMSDKEKKEEKVEKVSAAPKEQKMKWSMARCRKQANRFKNEMEWKKGAPSSYKAAMAHGWVSEISAHLKSKSGNMDKPMKKAA